MNLLPSWVAESIAREATQRLAASESPVWRPHPKNMPQARAYESEAFEILFGGQAGGGKSQIILGLARTQHTSSLILRREFPDLERSLIEESLKFYGSRDWYNASKHVWHIPTGRKRIEFGHMDNIGTANAPGDEAQYASAPYDFIGIDQLEQFPRHAYEFMFSRVRTTRPGQRLRIVSSANWVGPNIEWITERWRPWLDDTTRNPAQDGEIRWFARLDGKDTEVESGKPFDHKGERTIPRSRTFIASKLSDNPYLSHDEEYLANLQSLPFEYRAALLEGRRDVALADDAYQVFPKAWVKAAMDRWTPERPRDDKGNPVPLDAVGVDVARGGDDQTVKAPRYGNWYDRLTALPGTVTSDGQKVVDFFIADIANGGIADIDVIGVGAAAYDLARAKSLKVTGTNFAQKSFRRNRSGTFGFVNVRAERYWLFREALDPTSGEDIALPPDGELLADLISMHYSMHANGLQIEPKDEIKKRLGRSPDKGDACVLAYGASGTVLVAFG